MHIGILQAGHAPDEIRARQGDFSAMFQRLLGTGGITFTTWDVVDMDFPPGPEAADAWLITGSRHGVYEEHAFIPPLTDLIRAIHGAKMPLVGICFGHQIIAQALGGRVEKFSGGWRVGRQIYDWGGREIALNAWHQDQVITPPPGARTLASNPGCAHAALAIGDHILTIQPHPEFNAQAVAGLIAYRSATVPEPHLDQARADVNAPTDSARIAEAMRSVLKGSPA